MKRGRKLLHPASGRFITVKPCCVLTVLISLCSCPFRRCWVRSRLLVATTWYSGVFLLTFATRFACDICQSAKVWIWFPSEVITICIYWVWINWLLHYLLHRADETHEDRNSCPRLQFFTFSLNSIMSQSLLSVLRSTSLVSLFSKGIYFFQPIGIQLRDNLVSTAQGLKSPENEVGRAMVSQFRYCFAPDKSKSGHVMWQWVFRGASEFKVRSLI